jgi:hypothetical protein
MIAPDRMGSGNVSIAVTDRFENTVYVPFFYKNPYITRIAIQGPKMIIQGDYLENTSVVYVDDQRTEFRKTPTGLVADLLNASGSIGVELIDKYGNQTFYEGDFFYFIPAITQIVPHSGLKDSLLKIQGENLSNTVYVTIGGNNASIQRITPNEVDVIVPDGSGIVMVEVFEKNENSTKYAGRYTYETITLFNVYPLTAYSNEKLFIEGYDLSTIETVEFGEYSTSDIQHINSRLLTVRIPPIQIPSMITVKDRKENKGSYPDLFSRIIPKVTTISESRISGDLLRLTGDNLDQMVVLFDKTQAVIHTSSASTILCTIPYGKGTVPLRLKDKYQNTYLV